MNADADNRRYAGHHWINTGALETRAGKLGFTLVGEMLYLLAMNLLDVFEIVGFGTQL